MLNTILGTKMEMAQTFLSDGTRIPVTRIDVGPCIVTQVKTGESDGYLALQLGYGKGSWERLTKPLAGHLKKAIPGEETPPKLMREVRLSGKEDVELKVGDRITASEILTAGDIVDITGISRGKGFTGVVKRWGFKGGPKTHGQSDRERAPGSIGQTTTPGRVYKGKRMAGRTGNAQVTIRNLLVVKVLASGEVWVKGQIPGSRNGLVRIKKIGTAKTFAGLYEESKAEEQEGKNEQPVIVEKKTKHKDKKSAEGEKEHAS